MEISQQEDLVEAIVYFREDTNTYSSGSNPQASTSSLKEATAIRLMVVEEYEGPSLSEAGLSEPDGLDSTRKGPEIDNERNSGSLASDGGASGGQGRASGSGNHKTGVRDEFERSLRIAGLAPEISQEGSGSSGTLPPLPVVSRQYPPRTKNFPLEPPTDIRSEDSYGGPPGQPAPTNEFQADYYPLATNSKPSISSPPTYRSASSEVDASALKRRWFQAQQEQRAKQNGNIDSRLLHLGRNGKGKEKEIVNSGREDDAERSYCEDSATTSSIATETDKDDAFVYSRHLTQAPLNLTPSDRELAWRDTEPYDLPNFLADLSLSRRPTPSLLSSVPDEQLRCCGCQKIMYDFRYVCSSCGPILPESDDGSEGRTAYGHGGTSIIRLETPTSDPLGVIETSRLTMEATNLLNPRDHPSTSQKPSDEASAKDREGGGFELCIRCVETVGVEHAL